VKNGGGYVSERAGSASLIEFEDKRRWVGQAVTLLLWENDPEASAEAEAHIGGSSEGKERNASSSISEVSTSFLAQD
jgi:hypothetical protein